MWTAASNTYLRAETDTLNSVVQRGHTVTNAGDFILLGDQPDNGSRDAALRVLVGSHYGILATTAGDYAIYGIASGDMGVYGNASDDYGVRGYAGDDRGVYGESGDDYGVYGYANGSFGVYGFSPIGGFGGYFKSARTGLYVTVTGPGPVAYFDGAIALSGGVSIAKSDIDNWNAAETDPVWVAASGSVVYTESDPIWTAASNTAVFLDAQYPNAVLKDGTRAWTGPHNAGWNDLNNARLTDSTLVNVDGSGVTNVPPAAITQFSNLADGTMNSGDYLVIDDLAVLENRRIAITDFQAGLTITTNNMDATADSAYRGGGGGGGSGFPLTEDADFDGYGASNVISLVWSTNNCIWWTQDRCQHRRRTVRDA